MRVDNDSLMGKLFNGMDWMVRFLFCRVPGLRVLLRRMLFSNMYASNIESLDRRFSGVKAMLGQAGFDYGGGVVLEVGPGNSCAMGYNFMLSGAAGYIMVDKFPRICTTPYQIDFMRREIGFFERKYGRSLTHLVKGCVLNEEKIRFITNGVEDMRDVPDRSVDLVVSVNVLQHVKSAGKAFREMNRVLKEGGAMYHEINLRDHYNFNMPHRFLKYSDFVWENLLTREGFSYTNRLRADDFCSLVEQSGFEILRAEKSASAVPASPDKVHPRFRDKDLATEQLTMVARKKKSVG